MAEGPLRPGTQSSRRASAPSTETIQSSRSDDGTTQLLRSGSLITAVGAVAIGLLMGLLGGVGVEGAHNNSGWLALIVGAMCLPFGLMLLILGLAKWLRKRNLARNDRTPNHNSR